MSMETRIISREELKHKLEAGQDVVLLDVLPGEFFDEKHIPGACNACVYEVTFLIQVRAITADLDRPIIVYGYSCGSQASATAAEKLALAGYRAVFDYAGGLEAWEDAGYPLELHPERAVVVPCFRDTTYLVNVEKSIFYWIGRSLIGRHHGSITLSGGEISVEQGQVVGGHLTLDMETIRDLDLVDTSYNKLLVSHLNSDDFFDVGRFPTASFELDEAVHLPTATTGMPNYHVTGRLTIKGVSNKVEFPAIIAPREDGGISAQAHFDIDRTKWRVVYGSGKLFEKLGIHLVTDLISIELQLVAL